ncbi:MAG: proton-conducting transporter transmembrane domain-containing protein [Acidimicrobiales bacterium]
MSNISLAIAAAAGLTAAIAGGTLPAWARVRAAGVLTWGSCAAALVAAITVLHTGQPMVLHSSQVLPLTGVTMVLDPLGAVFVVVTAVVAIAATLYWLGYATHGLSTRTASAILPLFVTAMLLVPAAGSVATFLVLWELMALSSLLLVLVDQANSEAARSAAQWYAVMTHAGAAAILLALVVLSAHAGGQDFTAIRAHAGRLSPAVRGIVFVLALVGFGSKAGAVPLHVWLPKAHPEAPSPASALMSGAMVNLGIYGIVLVGDRLLGGGTAWWWLVVIAVGVISALFGALHAATSTDLKRLLAYSTADNMGLVLIGVGASGLFAATGHPAVAALGMVAALLVLVNHAAFKGSLFLSAGSVQVATGSRDLDRLGGLMRRMPVTGVVFIVGALSIAALPPLNGFVGEWLLFQSLLHGLPASSTAVAIAVPVGVAALALTGGLTAAAFVKAIGVGFLGRPRSTEATLAHEVPRTMQLGAGLLAGVCVVLGIVPMAVLPALERAAAMVVPGAPAHPLRGGVALHLAGLQGMLAPALLATGLVLAAGGIVGVRRLGRLGRRRPMPWPLLRRAEGWGCGRELQTARMQYTAISFAEPLERVFDDVLRPDRDLDVSHLAESRYYVEKVTYRTSIGDAVEHGMYRPVISAVNWWGRRARAVQNGSVHRYLAYGLVALVVILAVIA